MFRDLKPYDAMADSGTRWLGRVPAHWSVAGARSVFAEVGPAGHADEPLLSVTIGRGVLQQSDLLAASSKKDSSNVDRSKYKLVEPGDVAYNKMRAWQGAVGLSEYRGIVSPAYVVMRPRRDSGRYLHHLLRTPGFAKEAERRSYGITSDQWSLRPEHFKMIHFPVPPVAEQAAIVKYLGHAHARIDRAIAAKRKLIALLEEQKQAIINQAVTRGLDPTVPMKDSGIPWLGAIPEHWETRPLRSFARERDERAGADQNRLVLLSVSIRNGVTPRSESALRESRAEDFASYKISREGDLVLNRMRAFQGALGVSRVRGMVSPDYLVASIRPVVEVGYVEHSIRSSWFVDSMTRVLRGIGSISQGSARTPRINPEDFLRLRIPLPPRLEQKEIVTRIAAESASAEDATKRLLFEIELLREFRTRLTSDVVTGQLDVRAVAAALPDFVEQAAVDADSGEDESFDELDEVLEEAEG